MTKLHLVLFLITLAIFSCNTEAEDNPITGEWYKPTPETTFDWDLRDNIPNDFTYEASIVDIDAFDNSKSYVAKLQTQGKKVIAYVSVGSWEDWRPDINDFPASIIGNNYPDWDGEKFLDIRNIDALAPIMRARLDMIKEKGFDGIEPDNMDLNSWTTAELGFEITDADVIRYSKWLANEAHSRGLSIGQKNATDLAEQLVDTFDWILLEDAFNDNIQEEAKIYITNNKAVFATEYTDEMSSSHFESTVCPTAKTLKFTAILKHRELDGFIEVCN
ncbi:MAG TPA: endo alpha-1,4 polygalactosaminidase [Lutibacter sp.]|nr:endo alpha-1,4 polygalactosaminidase [Lutibacter sp.]